MRRGKQIGGGNCYGYDVAKQFASDGTPLRGDRIINEAQASIVRRIFEKFANGRSSKSIVKQFNPATADAGTGPFMFLFSCRLKGHWS